MGAPGGNPAWSRDDRQNCPWTTSSSFLSYRRRFAVKILRLGGRLMRNKEVVQCLRVIRRGGKRAQRKPRPWDKYITPLLRRPINEHGETIGGCVCTRMCVWKRKRQTNGHLIVAGCISQSCDFEIFSENPFFSREALALSAGKKKLYFKTQTIFRPSVKLAQSRNWNPALT